MDKANRDGDIEMIMKLSADAAQKTNTVIEKPSAQNAQSPYITISLPFEP
jgi:hypothetical protein